MPDDLPDTGGSTAPTLVITDPQAGSGDSTTDDDPITDWEAEAKRLQGEVEKHQTLSRKHEARAKANADAAKKLTEVERSSMSDIEKARAEAADQATSAAMARIGGRLVAAEVKAAAAGRPVDVEALLEGVDVTKFLDEDGEPKVKDIVAWLDRIAPVKAGGVGSIDLGQGARGGPARGSSMNDIIRRGAGH